MPLLLVPDALVLIQGTVLHGFAPPFSTVIVGSRLDRVSSRLCLICLRLVPGHVAIQGRQQIFRDQCLKDLITCEHLITIDAQAIQHSQPLAASHKDNLV